tara:strand:- start:376 stop:756 length:381 start_codon:yes stop_codon:yes gene_type:complete
MDYILKYFKCYQNHKSKNLKELQKDIDEIKTHIGIQKNPIHLKIERINELDKKIDDNNVDILTKIVYLKEEMQKIDTKIKELEINLNSKDNYCIIDNRMDNTSSDDSDSENSPKNSIVRETDTVAV